MSCSFYCKRVLVRHLYSCDSLNLLSILEYKGQGRDESTFFFPLFSLLWSGKSNHCLLSDIIFLLAILLFSILTSKWQHWSELLKLYIGNTRSMHLCFKFNTLLDISEVCYKVINSQLVSCWTYLLLSDLNFPEVYTVYINFTNSSHCITVLSLSWLKKKKKYSYLLGRF